MNNGANATLGAICSARIWRQSELGGRRHAEQIAEYRAHQAADEEARQHFARGDAGVQQQVVDMPHPQRLVRDHGERREDEGRYAEPTRSPLPSRQKDDEQGRACHRSPANPYIARRYGHPVSWPAARGTA
jgi:hypothetical protein